MASIGHVAVGMLGARVTTPPVLSTLPLAARMVAWSALALLPDIDAIGFHYGVPYGAAWGHRGATHSLLFAFAVAALITLCEREDRWRTGIAALIVITSHGLLDTLTDGGLGVALLWPFSLHRYFAPWRPIPVAPIGAAFFSRRGLSVATVELVLFAPIFIAALWPRRASIKIKK